MATEDSGGGKAVRLVVLVVLLVAVAGVFAWRAMQASGARVDALVAHGELLGKPLDEATTLLGVNPAEEPNNDPTSTARLYTYTLPAKGSGEPRRVFVQVQANKITRAEFRDAQGRTIDLDPDR